MSKSKTSSDKQALSIRLDKWLWAARFYKTRAVARQMIEGGKVQYNGQRSKPSKIVELGATIKLRQGNDEKIVVIEKISDQRRGAPEAQALYSETPESQELRSQRSEQHKLNALYSPSPDRRPDKKQRRNIIRFKQQ